MKIRSCFLILFLSFLFVILSAQASAVNTGFSTQSLPNEKKDTIISNVNVSLIKEEPAKASIVCFDVNNDKMIAIGQQNSNDKTVCVYSVDGGFQYGYTFETAGSFAVEWDGNNINIYLVRSDTLLSVDPNGKVIDALNVTDTSENNSYKNNFVYSTERVVGDNVFEMRNDMGILNYIAFSYSQVIMTGSDGSTTILYDVSSDQSVNLVVMCACIVAFVGVAVFIVARQFGKRK